MELADTVEMMLSGDYRERFKAEYFQTVNRHMKLRDMLKKWDEGKLDFVPSCPQSVLLEQEKAMFDYILALEKRACIEGIWERKCDCDEAAKEVKPEGEGSGIREQSESGKLDEG